MKRPILLLLPLFLLGVLGAAGAPTPKPVGPFQNADKLFKQQHWKEAQAAYDQARSAETDWHSPNVWRAVQQSIECSKKLELWDNAIGRATEYVKKTTGSSEEAAGQRQLAALELTAPHFGLKRAGKLIRGATGQGEEAGNTWPQDRRRGILCLERARDLLHWLVAHPEDDPGRAVPERARTLTAEIINVDFDLSAALAQPASQTGYWAQAASWWWSEWDEPDPEADADKPPDDDENRTTASGFVHDENTPTGVPVGADGRPRFIEPPARYSAKLGAGPKIRFLFGEIQRLDDSPKKIEAARALLRWAAIARSLYGAEAQPIVYRSDDAGLGKPASNSRDTNAAPRKIWELADDETLTLVGGKVRTITLPPAESPLRILRDIDEKYPECGMLSEAAYARGLYYQSRQQFPQAMQEYQKIVAADPKCDQARLARDHIKSILEAGVVLGSTGIRLPDSEIKLSFTCRNAGQVQFKATRYDLLRFVQDEISNLRNDAWTIRSSGEQLFENKRWKKYLGTTAATWVEPVPGADGNRACAGATVAPLHEPGAYIVEATVAGAEKLPSRLLVLISDIAIVQKATPGKAMILVADARTGQPLANKAVRIFEVWAETTPGNQPDRPRLLSVVRNTDKDGVILYSRRHPKAESSVDVAVAGDHGRIALSYFDNWTDPDPDTRNPEDDPRYYIITDRPVYRPGSLVRFRIWARERKEQTYARPRAGNLLHVSIHGPSSNEVQKLDLTIDEMGGATGELELSDLPPLGVWSIQISQLTAFASNTGGAQFRVEEYKKPEFEVTVNPAATQTRLGGKVKATISARYYYGAPVAQAKVTYKVFRENYQHAYAGAGPYDWLYGEGYGRVFYSYPWLPWWSRWGTLIFWNEPEGDDSEIEESLGRSGRDLVAQGEAALKPDGTLDVEIDTAPALRDLPNHDHRYTVQAEVRDASRRTIQGRGSVVATRQEFYAFIETDGGWFRPGNETFVEVRTLTADNVPVAAKGEVTVARIRYEGTEKLQASEEMVKRWDAETDADGRLSFKYPIPGEGQYRITFKTTDSWKQEVQGNAVFWVNGPKFDGRVYRFNDLEIIADKRTYKVGDTAHLLVNVAENNSRVLFSDNVSNGMLLSWKFLDVPSRSLVVDVPIEARHVPNFFVEATLVRNGRVLSDARELFVPPVRELLDLSVKTDKEVYHPGDKGKVRVEVKDSAGKPVSGEVTLTGYDEAITHMQDEFGPDPRIFFHGQTRERAVATVSSLGLLLEATGSLAAPQNEAGDMMADWRRTLRQFGVGDRPFNFISANAIDALLFEKAQGGEAMPPDVACGPARMGLSRGIAALAGVPTDPQFQTVIKALNGASGGKPGSVVEPEIRSNFADTALWIPRLALDANGTAESEITFPESLTTWRFHGYAITPATQVGDAMVKAKTTKNLIVRLQAPRFFVERDEVVLSANVNNYLKNEQAVKAELIIPAVQFQPMDGAALQADEEGNVHLPAEAKVAANGEHRFDWPVKVLKPGLSKITVKALTTEESDAMRMVFPVLVHGVNKQIAQAGAYRVKEDGARMLKLDLPAEIDPEQSRLEITLSPSLAGVMVDALPYLVGYPYGCVEQTMSRFYPTVLVAGALKKMGTNLEAIGKKRKEMDAGGQQRRFDVSPVFDSEELARMTRAGLERTYSFQHNDGGWGWWREDDSSPFDTAYVLQGLHAAQAAGVRVDEGVYDRGFTFLQNHISQELAKPKKKRELGDLTSQVYAAYILSLEHRLTDDMQKWLGDLYSKRGDLNNYGRAVLALAMQNERRPKEAATLLRNLLQFVDRDDTNETAWVRTPNEGWWFWWNNDIETNAWALKAMVAIDPKNDLAPRLVKWLLNNRRNGYYWRSTRDTAQVIAAMTDYMVASGESAPDYALTVAIDGQPAKEVRVNKENFFTFDNRVLLQGLQIKPGPHEITLTKTGAGALYYSTYLSYFTKEEDVKGAGSEIVIQREYFKLLPKIDKVRVPSGAAANTPPANQPVDPAGTGHSEQRAGFTRVPLKNGDAVTSGDQIEVVLKITAKNTYDYLAFEDMKPAGCEPVELRSGGRWAEGLCANLELRDQKVVFFIGLLEQGEHELRYKLRAETPGTFHALPTSGSAMYAPEIRAISDEMRLRVRD